MGVTNALSAAIGGLRTSQAGIAMVGQNVANADSPYYTKKSLMGSTRVIGEQVVGLRSGAAQRTLDGLLQQTLRTEVAGGTFAQVRAAYTDRLADLFGPVGSTAALDSIYNNFTKALQELSTSPENEVTRQNVLSRAQVLAQRLNGASDDIQAMRLETERGLNDAVIRANDALQRIQTLDRQIVAGSANSGNPVNLMDQRDQAIGELAELMDIRAEVGSDNSVSIFTRSGLLLFDDRAVTLEFDQRATLVPQAVYDQDPNQRGVGTITMVTPGGMKMDLIAQNSFRSGKIAGLLSLRDGTLVEAQKQLDEFAAGLARALSDQTVSGTAATVGAQTGFDLDVSGIQPGDAITLNVTRNGVPAKISIVRVEDPSKLPLPQNATADPNDEVIGVSFATPAGAAAAIQTALGASFTVSNTGSSLRFLDDGAAGATNVTGATGTFTATGLTGNDSALSFFVDVGGATPVYSGSFDGSPQKTGFAQRIAVNPTLLAQPSRLVNIGTATNAGDPARPSSLLDRLTKTTRIYGAAEGVGTEQSPASATVSGYIQRIVNAQGQQAETAALQAEGQEIVVNQLQDRFDEGARVNIDEEMSRLIELQQTYQASARIISVIDEMTKALLQAV
jgi:flagellar hook-associated protein 1 FlgK